MNTPTPEQIEAALRWVDDEWTCDDEMEFLHYDRHSSFNCTVVDILAAAYREQQREIVGLNAIITAATNTANANQIAAMESRQQRDTLAEALREIIIEEESRHRIDAFSATTAINALATLKGDA